MNETTIRKWWQIFKGNGTLTEVRIINPKKSGTYSGYFKDIDTLIEAIRSYEQSNIYFTLNPINDALFAREQSNRIIQWPKNTTADHEVIGREWCLIDIDPTRASGVNATDEEKEYAKEVSNKVYKFLRDNGFHAPVCADSANGYHILLRIQMLNNEESQQLIQTFLKVLDMLFSTDKAKVDVTNFNASRICKLYGTFSRKGSNTKERPQRESKFVRIPEEIKPTEKVYFEKIAALYPVTEESQSVNSPKYGQIFDLSDFLAKNNIGIHSKTKFSGGRKIVLKECPFNPQHKAPDSAIFVLDSGAIGFKCFHNSCSHYTWKDFRLLYEPNAYSKREYREFRHKANYYSQRKEFVPAPEDAEKGSKWLTMPQIKWVDISQLKTIPTGFVKFDKATAGLMMGDVTVLSGLSGSGKTSWLDVVALNVVQRGYKVAVWSGELQDFRFQSWINQIAAGRSFVVPKAGYDNFYYTPRPIADKINKWLDNKLFLYNNEYGSEWQQLFSDIKEIVEKEQISLVILDNLMALDINGLDGDKYSQQTKFINQLKEYAKKQNIHILLVAHPRKEMGFLRKESISGTADLTNLADNVLILHRVGRDFKKRAEEFFGEDKVVEFLDYSVVIEICKNRSLGVTDYLVGLYYEQESRRLKNERAEHIIYGWQEDGTQGVLPHLLEEEIEDIPDYAM